MKLFITIFAMLISATPSFASELILGAWASADDTEQCSTAPISLYMSDGTASIFMSEHGPIHSVGIWRKEGDSLYITHNDAPFPTDGQSKPEVELTVIQLDETHFVTRNAAGKETTRVRCTDIEITGGGEAHSH